MKIEKQKEYESKMIELVQEIVKNLRLTNWSGYIEFNYEQDGEAAAAINFDKVYKRYTIYIYKPTYDKWIEKDFSAVIEFIIHEHIHVVLNKLHEYAVPNFIEETIQHLTFILAPHYLEKYTKILKHENKSKTTKKK